MIPVLHGVWAAAGGLVGDFEHIETQTVGAGGAANITFSSIPGTYKHLQIRFVARSTRSGFAGDDIYLQINSDTASNYSYHLLYGSGSGSGTSAGAGNSTIMFIAQQPAANAGASIFGGGVLDILGYASTTTYKTTRSLAGNDRNGSGEVGLYSSSWRNTNAVTSLKFTCSNSFAEHSTFALYGVK